MALKSAYFWTKIALVGDREEGRKSKVLFQCFVWEKLERKGEKKKGKGKKEKRREKEKKKRREREIVMREREKGI